MKTESRSVTTTAFTRPKDTRAMYRQYATYLRNQNKSEGTVNVRVKDLQRFETWFGNSPLLAQFEDLMDYRNKRLNAAKPEYLRHVFISFRAFYNWALKSRLVLANPASDLPPIKRAAPVVAAVPEDIALKTYLDASNEHLRAIVALVGGEALRRSEVASLHPRNRRGRKIEVLGKGGKIRSLPLGDSAYEALLHLEEIQGTDAYYFPGRFGGHVHPCSIYRWLRDASGWNTHAFRKRAATYALKNGASIRTVQVYLGHDSLETTMAYLEVTWDDLEQMSKITNFPAVSTRHRLAGSAAPQMPRVIQIDLDNPTQEQFLLVMEAAKKLFAA